MLVISVLLLFVSSGLAYYTSNDFADNPSTRFDNYSRTSKPYFRSDLDHNFEQFIRKYGKVYKTPTEKRERFKIFKDNLMKANHLNTIHARTTYGITEFADLTSAEYNERFSGLSGPHIECQRATRRNDFPYQDLDTAFDWRDRGVVTPVKHQSTCNSCYAWSTIGNLEGQVAIKYGKLHNLSVQQIVDCDYWSAGCEYGWLTNAGMYLVHVGGAMLESAYPYQNERGPCEDDKSKFFVQVVSCHQFPLVDEENLKQVLVAVGPLSVAVDGRSFNLYTGGIFYDCGTELTHALLLVGYGEEDGTPYWTLKNTLGPNWGEEGYIRLPMGQNACGIVNQQIMTLQIA